MFPEVRFPMFILTPSRVSQYIFPILYHVLLAGGGGAGVPALHRLLVYVPIDVCYVYTECGMA